MAGLVDDLLVTVIMLNKIIAAADAYHLDKIETYWAGEEDIFLKIREITARLHELPFRIPAFLFRDQDTNPEAQGEIKKDENEHHEE